MGLSDAALLKLILAEVAFHSGFSIDYCQQDMVPEEVIRQVREMRIDALRARKAREVLQLDACDGV